MEKRSVGWESTWVNVNGGQSIRCVTSRQENTAVFPVVLVHDYTGNWECLRRLADEIRKTGQWRVIIVSLPGHGVSDPPESYTVKTLSETFQEVLDRLSVTEPLLYGQSFGGLVCAAAIEDGLAPRKAVFERGVPERDIGHWPSENERERLSKFATMSHAEIQMEYSTMSSSADFADAIATAYKQVTPIVSRLVDGPHPLYDADGIQRDVPTLLLDIAGGERSDLSQEVAESVAGDATFSHVVPDDSTAGRFRHVPDWAIQKTIDFYRERATKDVTIPPRSKR